MPPGSAGPGARRVRGSLSDVAGMAVLFIVHRAYYDVRSHKAQSDGYCFYEGKE